MKVGEFELELPAVPLKEPHCVAFLSPWVNSGNVSEHILKRFSSSYNAQFVGSFREPGKFYDFTRYRPQLTHTNGVRNYTLPNTSVFVCESSEALERDLVLLNMLEPHMLGEKFNREIVQLLIQMGVKRYILTGGMYDLVPHTRTLPVSAAISNWEIPEYLRRKGVVAPAYQGPTSIASMISHVLATKAKMETMSLIVHLPLYHHLKEHYMGSVRLLTVLSHLYPLLSPRHEDEVLGVRAKGAISSEVENNPRLRKLIEQLEKKYDDSKLNDPAEPPALSSEIQEFLTEITEDASDS